MKHFRPSVWEKTLASVTSGFLFMLAWATDNAVGAGDGDLNFEAWWPWLLLAGGIMAAYAVHNHNSWTWAITAAWVTSVMIVRGMDLAMNAPEFDSRVYITLVLWVGGGLLSGVAWLAVGAMSDALEEADG